MEAAFVQFLVREKSIFTDRDFSASQFLLKLSNSWVINLLFSDSIAAACRVSGE